jgi:C4-type Zn-finger protein
MPTPTTPLNRKALAQPEPEEAILHKLMGALRDLRRQGKLVRIRICPQCKSPDLRLLESHYDIGGAMGITPTKYRCPRCGYWGRVIIEATNEDISEAVLDDLLSSDIAMARTFLKEIEAKVKKPQ